ncbi:Hypothetical_protein [Hexamita inflata]|uniref:Hypothetical_protein n=1 Tax=Hexamita inflata TaxID=28002 RepID=A0AA86TWN6_9EUKA|nr:Hypothetical protein HINF_LOCUS18811 [Hexamita inflata]
MNLPLFSLFGLTNSIQLQNANLSVNIPQQLSQGSLICFTCDLNAKSSEFTFIASAQNVSGVVLYPLTLQKLNQSLVQFRLNGVNVGGLILNASKIAVSMSQCNISGYVGLQSVSGSIICYILNQVSLEVDIVRICANVQNFGQGILTYTGTISATCFVCGEKIPTYGLCQKSLKFGKLEDDKIICPSPFIFDGEECSCKEGDVLNGTSCVNILTSVSLLNTKQIKLNNSFQDLTNRTIALDNTTKILNQAILDQKEINQLLNQTLTSTKQIIQQQQQVIEELALQVYCLNNRVRFQNAQCFTNYEITGSEVSLSCSSQIYIVISYIPTITHQVVDSGNFSNGYVFATTTIIQNALVDIYDNVYSTYFYPLFQSQNTFTNLKIQFGAQTLNIGSFILSSIQSITINQMNIISRVGSQITVNANSQLNILTDSLIAALINNLLINLSFASSSGNITLINNVNGVLNISEYQVNGDYNSTQTVVMIGLNVKTAIINVNRVSFKPSTFNVGNGSSFLFGNQESGESTLSINNLSVIIGSSSNFQLLGSISTTTYNTYLFGGIIAYIKSVSSININNVLLDAYQMISTNYVSEAGFLVGYVISNSNSIMLKNICLQQNMTSTTLEFTQFGLIGENSGNISIQNAYVTFTVQIELFRCFGIIGYQNQIYFASNSLYAEVINMKTSVSISGSGSNVGQIFGSTYGNCFIKNTSIVGGTIGLGQISQVGGFIGSVYNDATIFNSSIFNSNISGSIFTGGIIGLTWNNIKDTNTTIMDSSIINMTISGLDTVGGIIGTCYSYLYLTNTQIQVVHISTSGLSFGVVIGSNITQLPYFFSNSTARSNFINGVKQTECAVLTPNSITGC